MMKHRVGMAIVAAALVGFAQEIPVDSGGTRDIPDSGATVAVVTSSAPHKGTLVRMGTNVIVRADETYEDVVVIGGSADVAGNVTGDLVVIGGNARLSGRVDGSFVVVGGSGACTPQASVKGDLVAVGGAFDIPDAVFVGGDKVLMPPFFARIFDGAKRYVKTCIFTGRFISPSMPWTVGIFCAAILLGMLLSLIFAKTYQRGVHAVIRKPGMTFLMGIVSSTASGPVIGALVATVIGIPVVPVIIVVLMGLSMIGSTALYGALGTRLLQPFVRREVAAVLAVVVGAVLAVGLAMVPWVGGLSMIFGGVFGSGAGLLAFIDGIREMQNSKNGTPPKRGPGSSVAGTTGTPAEGIAANVEGTGASLREPAVIASVVESAEPETRLAGVWQRFAAAVIDFIIVAAAYGATVGAVYHRVFSDGGSDGSVKVGLLLIYLAVFWGWKGTTVGNIVMHLRVQKLGGGKLTWDVAIVRSLSLILSFITCGVGFFWLHWDRRRQAWHDMIAGTEVVVVPKGISLM